MRAKVKRTKKASCLFALLKFWYSRTRVSSIDKTSFTTLQITFELHLDLSAVSTTTFLDFQSPRKKTTVSEKQSIYHTYVILLISYHYNQKSCASCDNLYKSHLNCCMPVTDCYAKTLPCDIFQLLDLREKWYECDRKCCNILLFRGKQLSNKRIKIIWKNESADLPT